MILKSLFNVLTMPDDEMVSAREVHELLGIKQPFHLWFHRAAKGAKKKNGVDWFKDGGDYILTADTCFNIVVMAEGRIPHEVRGKLIQMETDMYGPDHFLDFLKTS